MKQREEECLEAIRLLPHTLSAEERDQKLLVAFKRIHEECNRKYRAAIAAINKNQEEALLNYYKFNGQGPILNLPPWVPPAERYKHLYGEDIKKIIKKRKKEEEEEEEEEELNEEENEELLNKINIFVGGALQELKGEPKKEEPKKEEPKKEEPKEEPKEEEQRSDEDSIVFMERLVGRPGRDEDKPGKDGDRPEEDGEKEEDEKEEPREEKPEEIPKISITVVNKKEPEKPEEPEEPKKQKEEEKWIQSEYAKTMARIQERRKREEEQRERERQWDLAHPISPKLRGVIDKIYERRRKKREEERRKEEEKKKKAEEEKGRRKKNK